MIKHLYRKKSHKRDVRFVDAETYRAERKPSRMSSALPLSRIGTKAMFVDYAPKMPVEPSMKHNLDWLHSPPVKDLTDPNEAIHVLEQPLPLVSVEEHEEITLERGSDLVNFLMQESKRQQSKLSENRAQSLNANSLGIFSDSRMYSAMIKQELRCYQLDIQHFNHPNTFLPTNYHFFDQVSAWIVFLSDDCDEAFLDQFIDRYYEKPTLFLCPKMTRKNATERLKLFISDYELEKKVAQATSK